MKIKLLTISVAAFAVAGFSACGPATTNVANKTGNAANVVSNAAGNTANAVSNATTNANTMANTTANTAATAADGTVINIDEAGLTMTAPKGMNFSKEDGDVIVKTADNGVDTRFTVLNDENVDKVIEDAFKEVDDYVKDAKFTSKEGKKSTQNGLDITSYEGTGKADNGDDVQFQLAIVSIPDSPKKPVMALTYAEKESIETHKADLGKFFASIKKQ